MGWISRFYGSTIGKKFIVGITGLGMVLFLIAHLVGNLKVYEGRDAMIEYAELLRWEPVILWAFRLGLLAFLVLHVTTILQLTRRNAAARPVSYASMATSEASGASRTMVVGGVTILLYVIYHVLHLTLAEVHTGMVTHGAEHVYDNVVASFQRPLISGVYILAQVALFFHLSHGIQSAFRTLGVSHPRYVDLVRHGGRALSFIIVVGFISIPVAVLTGVVK